jgi:CheY-like chemotaxis protein
MLGRARDWPRVDHPEVVRRSRIVVIDDSEFPYLKLFRRDGYNMDKWNDVRDLPALERGEYDVILLDLQGVGRSLSSDDQGLGVLAHLRETAPAQIVVAYSNAEWSVAYQSFFESADAVLHKTKDDYMAFKRTVDQLLTERFSVGFYVDRAMAELGDMATDDLRKRTRQAILRQRPDKLRHYLSGRVDDLVTVDRVIAVTGVAISVAQLWKS